MKIFNDAIDVVKILLPKFNIDHHYKRSKKIGPTPSISRLEICLSCYPISSGVLSRLDENSLGRLVSVNTQLRDLVHSNSSAKARIISKQKEYCEDLRSKIYNHKETIRIDVEGHGLPFIFTLQCIRIPLNVLALPFFFLYNIFFILVTGDHPLIAATKTKISLRYWRESQWASTHFHGGFFEMIKPALEPKRSKGDQGLWGSTGVERMRGWSKYLKHSIWSYIVCKAVHIFLFHLLIRFQNIPFIFSNLHSKPGESWDYTYLLMPHVYITMGYFMLIGAAAELLYSFTVNWGDSTLARYHQQPNDKELPDPLLGLSRKEVESCSANSRHRFIRKWVLAWVIMHVTPLFILPDTGSYLDFLRPILFVFLPIILFRSALIITCIATLLSMVAITINGYQWSSYWLNRLISAGYLRRPVVATIFLALIPILIDFWISYSLYPSLLGLPLTFTLSYPFIETLQLIIAAPIIATISCLFWIPSFTLSPFINFASLVLFYTNL